jgi:hypothetical protein
MEACGLAHSKIQVICSDPCFEKKYNITVNPLKFYETRNQIFEDHGITQDQNFEWYWSEEGLGEYLAAQRLAAAS